VWEAAYDRPVPARGHDPYAVTPSDPLDDWPPRKRPPFWHPGYATGTDWIVTVLSPGSGLLLLWARTTLDSGEEASAVFLFLLAAAFGLTALVQYLVRLFSKPFPPWLGMFVASAAGTALWVRYAVIPLLGSQRP
jgi:hypothetical protein